MLTRGTSERVAPPAPPSPSPSPARLQQKPEEATTPVHHETDISVEERSGTNMPADTVEDDVPPPLSESPVVVRIGTHANADTKEHHVDAMQSVPAKQTPSLLANSETSTSSSPPQAGNVSASASATHTPSQRASGKAPESGGAPFASVSVRSPERDALVDDFSHATNNSDGCTMNEVSIGGAQPMGAAGNHMNSSTTSSPLAGKNGGDRRYSIPPRFTNALSALVQYDEQSGSTPYNQSRPIGSGSSRGQSPSKHTEVRTMLVSAERELADVRGECAKRGIALDTLEVALQRERDVVQSLRERHFEEMEETRNEHEAQTRQLREQLRVLKMVSEGAMADKAKTAEDAERRKKELLSLLEREREEKAHLMADYREQTESLIAEQGREITSLRVAMDKIKSEYDRLSAEHEAFVDARASLSAQLEEEKGVLDRERMEFTRRLNDLQSRLHDEKECLQDQLSLQQEEQLRASARAQNRIHELTDDLQRMQEKLSVSEEQSQHALDSIRHTHRRELEALQRELQAAKAQREQQSEEHRVALEAALRSEEKSSEMLRQTHEEVRKELEDAVADGYRQREEMQVLHRAKVTQLQTIIDTLSAEVTDERGRRKDAESAAEVLKNRAENFQKTAQDLSRENEALQSDRRTKERAAEHSHQEALEEVRTKLRAATTELAYAQQQLRQQAVEHQRARDDAAMKSTVLEKYKNEVKDVEERFTAQMTKQTESYESRTAELEKNCEQARVQNRALEAERLRLERALSECEHKLATATKVSTTERATIEMTNVKLQDLKGQADDLRQALQHVQARNASLEDEKRELLRELQEARVFHGELETAVQLGERRAQESSQDMQRVVKAHEAKLQDMAQRHSAELAAVRLSVDQARGDGAKAREALLAKDVALQQLREHLSDEQRAWALREGALQEELEDLQEQHESEMRRMDELLNGLRSSLNHAQAVSTQCQQELANIHRGADGRHADLEAALEQSESARARLQEDARYREQLNQELQGTVRLLTARLGSQEEEVHKLQDELTDSNRKMQDAHTVIGRKDAAIGQLNAKLRAYESRGGAL